MQDYLKLALNRIQFDKPEQLIVSALSKHFISINENSMIKEPCSSCITYINDEEINTSCPSCNGKGFIKRDPKPLTKEELESKIIEWLTEENYYKDKAQSYLDNTDWISTQLGEKVSLGKDEEAAVFKEKHIDEFEKRDQMREVL